MLADVQTRPDPVVAGQDALFLDLDGTLAPLFDRPDETILGISVRRQLVRLRQALDGRIAVVSGRSLAVIDRIVAIPGLAAAGIHGLERRSASGSVTRVKASAGLLSARRELASLVALTPRLLLEDKGASLALHFRMAPDLEAVAQAAAASIADRHGLVLQAGKMVVEVRQPGPDKGAAINAFMAEAPFQGARPVFVGDDITDEAGFAAVAGLGGHGILVGQPRPSAAIFRLTDIADVETWLATGATTMELP